MSNHVRYHTGAFPRKKLVECRTTNLPLQSTTCAFCLRTYKHRLKEKLKAYKLPVGGKKSDLITRLEEYEEGMSVTALFVGSLTAFCRTWRRGG